MLSSIFSTRKLGSFIGALLWSSVQASPALAVSLTITSIESGDTQVLELPDTAKLDIEVTENGIHLTVPNINLRVKCLGLASAPNTCTLLAGGGGAAGDGDGDGVPDQSDQCKSTPPNEFVDSSGCALDEKDADGDGVPNGSDTCANTPSSETADSSGCSPSQQDTDTDGDGVSNDNDQCPSEQGPASNDGCPIQGIDTSLYCSGAGNAPTTVTCSKSRNLDSIYENSNTVEYEFGSKQILALPFTITDQSATTGAVFGSIRMVTDEPSLGGGGANPGLRMWFSNSPGGAPIDGPKCEKFLQEADGGHYWSQYPDNNACTLGLVTTSGVRYLNFAVACPLSVEECTTANQFAAHNGYKFEMTRNFQN